MYSTMRKERNKISMCIVFEKDKGYDSIRRKCEYEYIWSMVAYQTVYCVMFMRKIRRIGFQQTIKGI